jgi:hypothetical protein
VTRRRRAVLVSAVVAAVAGCASVGVGVSIPIGRMGGISIGGSIPLPRPDSGPAPAPVASAPEAAASAAN